MTMRNPTALVDAENTPIVPTYDPAKRYRFTWPGQPARTVNGDELAALLKGANPTMLAIEEVADAPAPALARTSRDPG